VSALDRMAAAVAHGYEELTPCRRIVGRFHHGACGCFVGGEAGEWWHEAEMAQDATREALRPGGQPDGAENGSASLYGDDSGQSEGGRP
jgi:hypothetical protein